MKLVLWRVLLAPMTSLRVADTRVHWFGLMPEDEVRLDYGT